MPVMNGIEAGSVLGVMLPDIPIVIYTAHTGAMVESHALAVGVRAVIEKNDMAGLAGQLQNLLGPSRTSSPCVSLVANDGRKNKRIN